MECDKISKIANFESIDVKCKKYGGLKVLKIKISAISCMQTSTVWTVGILLILSIMFFLFLMHPV